MSASTVSFVSISCGTRWKHDELHVTSAAAAAQLRHDLMMPL